MSAMDTANQLKQHYESCFLDFGDTAKGADWPSEVCARQRYQVMSDLFGNENRSVSVLDYGCGTARFLDYLKTQAPLEIDYTGVDISEIILKTAKKKHPAIHFCTPDKLEGHFDYTICNGLFTEKLNLSHKSFFNFTQQMLISLFSLSTKGLAFNVMSKNVQWERTDLFHPSLDEMTWFLSENLSRHIRVRQDYGLFECTFYVYKRGEA